MRRSFIKLAPIPAKITGEKIYIIVVIVHENTGLNLCKIVSVTTDGIPSSMIGKYRGVVCYFQKTIGHPLIGFHCISSSAS